MSPLTASTTCKMRRPASELAALQSQRRVVGEQVRPHAHELHEPAGVGRVGKGTHRVGGLLELHIHVVHFFGVRVGSRGFGLYMVARSRTLSKADAVHLVCVPALIAQGQHQESMRPLDIADALRWRPWRGSDAYIMFLALNICCVSSGTVSARYCCDPRDVSGTKPVMKKCSRGKDTRFTASLRRSELNWPEFNIQ